MAERSRRAVAGLAVLAAAGAGTGWVILRAGPHTATADPAPATRTTRVVRTDVTVRDLVDGTLGYVDQASLLAAAPGTVTWLPAIGSVIATDHRLYEVDGRPVLLWRGTRPAWRDLSPGMSDGPDVAQLERNLAALGFGAGLRVDDHFSPATAAAVRRWQAAHGLPRTGTVELGRVVFRPSAARIGALSTTVGAPLSPGTAVLTVTGTATTVAVGLDPNLRSAAHVGDLVRISAPGGAHPATGRVAAVGAPVVAAAATPATPTQAGAAAPAVTVPVTISLHPAPGGPDIGEVQVAITTATDRDVLAVPVDALLAAPGGGFRVAVHDGGRRRLVTVHTGLFDESDGLVEVDGVAEGDQVEVPLS